MHQIQFLDTAGPVSKLSQDLMFGTRILITDYGDIAYEKDEDSFVKAATVNVSSWFEGHLPG